MRFLKNVLVYSLSVAIVVIVAWTTVWAIHSMKDKISTWDVPTWDFSGVETEELRHEHKDRQPEE